MKLSELIAKVTTLLDPVAPSVLLDTGASKHGDAPRFAWTPVDGPIGGVVATGRNPPNVGTWALAWRVECWGGDSDKTLWLVCALLTAVRKGIGPGNYEVRATRWRPQANDHRGLACDVTLVLMLALPKADLTAAPSTGGPTYADATHTTATVNTVNHTTPATSTPGDGLLEGGEP